MEARHGEAQSEEQETPQQEVVRPAGEAEVPGSRPGTRIEREGESDAAVQEGPHQQVDEEQDPRSGEPQTEALEITLDGPTAYADHPPIPDRFQLNFIIHVLPPHSDSSILHHSVDPSIYEGDLVSDTIRRFGIWEVPQTIILSSAFDAVEETTFLDVGSHVGWYSLLAMARSHKAIAIDGDPRMTTALSRSAEENGWTDQLTVRDEFIDDGWWFDPPGDNFIVKIDVEGSEKTAIAGLWELFEERKVSHLVMEVSPVFEDYYPDLLGWLIKLGYVAYTVPAKMARPPVVADVRKWLTDYGHNLHLLTAGSRRQWIQKQKQFDVVMFHEDSRWA